MTRGWNLPAAISRSGLRLSPTRCLAMLLLCFLVGSAQAAYNKDGGSVSGRFEYYVLTLSWSPAFCLESPMSAQCSGPRAFGFIVHGLWPQNERGWPERCERSRPPRYVVDSMLDLMPARGLIEHEWSTHGSCSGLDPQDYFRLVRTASARVNPPTALSLAKLPIEESPEVLRQTFLKTNQELRTDSLVITCSGGSQPRLREVRICLTRDLAPRACSSEVLRGACRANTLLIPPIR